MKQNIKKLILDKDGTIKKSIKSIMENGCGSIFLTDKNGCFVSVVTDGDIRKAMFEGRQLEDKVIDIASKDPIFVWNDLSNDQIIRFLKAKNNLRDRVQYGGTLKIPVLDRKKKITNVLFVSIRDNNKHIIECDLGATHKVKNVTGVRTVLVTGGAGYLGSILCRKLINKNFQVRALDNLMYGDESIRSLYNKNNFKLIKGDIRDLEIVVEAIKDVDAVIHLAAIVGDPAATKFPQKAIDVNYLATKALVEACKYYQVNRFIFASTCSIYGKSISKNKKLSIGTKPNPVSLYAKMKLESEKAILSLSDENFSPTILRMSTLFGLSPRMRFDLAVNLLTAHAVSEKQISIFGGKQWRPFLHVADAADAYIKCLELPFNIVQNRIFNLGADNLNYQLSKVGDLIKEIMPDIRVNISKKKCDQRDYKVSFTDATRILNFDPNHSLADGIAEIKDSILKGRYKDYKSSNYSNVIVEN